MPDKSVSAVWDLLYVLYSAGYQDGINARVPAQKDLPYTIDQALQSIRQIVEGCVPEKKETLDSDHPTMHIPDGKGGMKIVNNLENKSFNSAIDTMKANVEKAFGEEVRK